MAHALPKFMGYMALFGFFAFDYAYAKQLNRHKAEHPELEECAPAESPDLDTVAVFESLASTTAQAYRHQHSRLTGAEGGDYTSMNDPTPSADAATTASGIVSTATSNPLHSVVVVCGVVAPIFAVLSFLFPHAFGWTTFHVPLWLSYLLTVPGLAATVLYAVRTYALSGLVEVTRSQWIAMMWFRLDFMFILGCVALLGIGAWVVAGCMFGVAAYLAHRVMKMERQLNRVQRQTQLVRGEVDVTRVLVPGSEESRRAMGETETGYSAMNKA